MSKPKPPHTPTSQGSAVTAVMRETIRLRLELIRRMEYRDLQALKARLAELPPVPEDTPSPANET